ncbi:MAG: VOC family protein [Planctomycetota bacterium]
MSIFRRLDHVSIGVKDHEKAERLFIDIFGGERMGDAGVSPGECFRWSTFKLGGKKVELVSPTEPGAPGVGKYLEKYGEGMHHLSISVDNLSSAIAYFQSQGVRVLAENDSNPLWRHCYLHPADTFGVLIQVFEENEQTLKGGE